MSDVRQEVEEAFLDVGISRDDCEQLEGQDITLMTIAQLVKVITT